MSIDKLEEAKKDYLDRYAPEGGMDEEDALNIGLFMGQCIKLFKEVADGQEKLFECAEIIDKNMKKLLILYNVLEKRIEKLEQSSTTKHRELLNNCVSDDEVILHKREIEEVKVNDKT